MEKSREGENGIRSSGIGLKLKNETSIYKLNKDCETIYSVGLKLALKFMLVTNT